MAESPAALAPWQQQLTPRLRRRVERLLEQQQEQPGWHGALPVLLLERCWLRMSVAPIAQLARMLPPDSSADAPELSLFRQLRADGLDGLEAQERCWQEFGREACTEALRRFWSAQEQGNHGWTLERYLHLVEQYRRQLDQPGPRPIPLLVLAREGSGDAHHLIWCWPGAQPVGHTCP